MAVPPPAERWACGVAASHQEWPPDRYTFQLTDIGRPVYLDHEPDWLGASGYIPGDVGVCRRFAEVDGLVIVLLEITAPAVLLDLAAGKRTGLSVTAHLDPPPDGGPDWVYIAEVSLTSRPKDPLARVVSTGLLALRDWETLTGEAVAAGLGGVPAA
jgi:hypothetical protein